MLKRILCLLLALLLSLSLFACSRPDADGKGNDKASEDGDDYTPAPPSEPEKVALWYKTDAGYLDPAQYSLPTSVNVGDPMPHIPPVLKDGATFCGWKSGLNMYPDVAGGFVTDATGAPLDYCKYVTREIFPLHRYNKETYIILIPEYVSDDQTDIGGLADITVTFHYNDGTYRTSTVELTTPTEYDEIAKPMPKTDFADLVGWSIDKDEDIPFADGTVSADLELYGVWRSFKYVYLYSHRTDDRFQKLYQGDTLTLWEPVAREGYVFEGWYDNEAYNGTPVTSTTYAAQSNTFYAKWTPVSEG